MGSQVIYNGWLCEVTHGCTCAGGDVHGHEPDCGLEPLTDITELLTEHDFEVAAKAWDEGRYAWADYERKCEDSDAVGLGVHVREPVNPYRANINKKGK